jgi:TRAP-type C4-dicarboxylate transport system substrate-binding protein
MKITRALLSFGTAVLTAGVISQASAKDFNASIWFPDSHPLTNFGYLDWAKSVESASGGALKPKVFTGTVLLPPAAHLSGVRDGIAHVTYHAGTYTPADLPEDNLLAQLAFSYSDYFLAVFATTDMNLNDPEMQGMWKRNGVVYGGGYATPPYRLFCTSKVTTLEEIKGKRLRMPGAAHSDWAKSVGAVPVNVPSSEMYNGLEKGQLDCASNAANDMKSRSLWDVAKHTTMIELGVYWAGYEYAFNPDFWKGLTAGERRILFDTMAVAMVKTGHGYMKGSDDAVAEAPEHGVTVYEPSAELKESVSSFRNVARAKAIELGKSKFDLKAPEGLINRFEKVIAKWQKLLANIDRNDEAALVAVLKKEIYDKIDVATYGTD